MMRMLVCLRRGLGLAALAVVSLLSVALPVRAETILSITQTSYDANDRPVCSVVRMDLASTETDACTPRQSTNGPDRVTKTVYDADGNVTDVIRAFGILKQAFDENLQQTYAHYGYTLNGKKADETDANGNKTSLTYDGFDRLASLIYPSSTTPGVSNTNDKEVYTYDPNGNRASFTRRGGQVYTYSYDALNRQTLKTRSDNTGLNVISRYDLMGRLITASFANASGTITNSYDKLGRQLTAMDVNSREISYQYDQASKRTYLTYPDTSVQQKYEYNTAGMLTWTGLADGSVKVTPGYDPEGRVTSIARPNGVNTTLEYDDLDRMARLFQNMNGTARDIDWGFTRNPASQITKWTATSTAYDYVQTQSKADNRAYNGLNQDATLAPTTTACPAGGYDLNGNLICDGPRRFTYDIDNHLITVAGTATGTLEYDPLGRLSKTTFGSTVTSFLYDGVNLIGEYDAGGTLQTRYMHALGDDQPFVQFAGSSVAASNAKYLIANYQGSIIALADASGNVADADLYKYGPWGEPKGITNADQWSGSRFRYTGQTILPEAKLYYYKARVYDPVLGRFLQTDPIGSKDDMDLYAYTAGDPINGSDPTGLWTLQVGVSFKVNIFGLKGTVQFGAAIDGKGNIAGYAQGGGVVGDAAKDVAKSMGKIKPSEVAKGSSSVKKLGASETAGVTVGVSNASSVTDLKGDGAYVSASAGAVVGGTVEAFTGADSEKGSYKGVAVTIGEGAGADIDAGVNKTVVSDVVNIPEKTLKPISDELNRQKDRAVKRVSGG